MNDKNYNNNGCGLTAGTWIPPGDASAYDDIIKRSNCSGLSFVGISATGARPQENWFDFVRGSNYSISRCEIGDAGVSGITIKGAICGWRVEDCVFSPCARREIEVGQFDDYWYPGRAPTRGGIIERVRRSDGKPVRVTLWDAERPTVVDSNVTIVKVPKVIWFPYFIFRRLVTNIKGRP